MLDTTMTKYVWRGEDEIENESVDQAWQTLKARPDMHDKEPYVQALTNLETPREQRREPT